MCQCCVTALTTVPCSGVNFQTYDIAEPCPSSVFQNHLHEYLESDSEAAVKLINTMLNQLNWAFSEFVRILQEVVATFCALTILIYGGHFSCLL